MSNSEEEEIARNYICFEKHDAIIIVVDATCLERNLNIVYQILEITSKVIVCVNLIDEAKKDGISINLEKLSDLLGVPVVGTIANKPKTLNKLIEVTYNVCTRKNFMFSQVYILRSSYRRSYFYYRAKNLCQKYKHPSKVDLSKTVRRRQENIVFH